MTDQTPAADPALDSLDRLHDAAVDGRLPVADDVRIIRGALADRITPAEAKILMEWMEGPWHDPAERTLIARLGRIADRETGR